MPVPRRRHCPARRDRNRTHKKLKVAHSLSTCPTPDCGQARLPHRVCSKCGEYMGRFYGAPAKAQGQA